MSPRKRPPTAEDLEDETELAITYTDIRVKRNRLVNLLNDNRSTLTRGPALDLALMDLGLSSMLEYGVPRKEVERFFRELMDEAVGKAEGAEAVPVPVEATKKPRFH